jgi:hypothetical protein
MAADVCGETQASTVGQRPAGATVVERVDDVGGIYRLSDAPGTDHDTMLA